MLRAYQKAIHGTRLAGPTYFAEFLKRVKSEIVANVSRDGIDGNLIYSVIIVLTDGNIHDMEATKTLMV